MYQAWNASGSGDGMKQKGMETGEQEVDLENLPTQSGDCLDFLSGANPCVMYLWYKLLSHGLFQTSAAEFPVGLGADGGVAPDISVASSVAASKESYKEDSGVSAMALHIGSLVTVQSKMNREENLQQMSLRALIAERTENTQENCKKTNHRKNFGLQRNDTIRCCSFPSWCYDDIRTNALNEILYFMW